MVPLKDLPGHISDLTLNRMSPGDEKAAPYSNVFKREIWATACIDPKSRLQAGPYTLIHFFEIASKVVGYMLQWVKRQLDQLDSPTLDWIQIEVTTHCNGSCIYCPHTLMQNHWANKHLPIDLFRKLIPYLKHVDLVYLQGWGEPLLHQDFFEMVRMCKDQGKRVGFTTNGMLLSEDTIHVLIALELDIVAVSLAGTTAGTHNQIRKGTDFHKVICQLDRLREIKAQRKVQLPAVHLAYLMLKSNFEELKGIPQLAKRVGANQIVASNLSLILDPSLLGEAIFLDQERIGYYRDTLNEVRRQAAIEDMVFEYRSPGFDSGSLGCSENVHRACVVNVQGEVIPCVFVNPVLASDYIFEDQSLPIEVISFGNIRNQSLTGIWNKKEYRHFRNLFHPETEKTREEIRSQLHPSCAKCYKRLGA
jgi:MoaA/NifB/PqqE/SkfB family radical SAM enzyme